MDRMTRMEDKRKVEIERGRVRDGRRKSKGL